MKKTKISMKDIAQIVGVSTATVSFVINGKGPEKNISRGMINRVLGAVSRLGYQPNSLAKNLKQGRSYIIGFLVSDISLPFFSQLASFLESRMADHGYTVLMSSLGKEGRNFQNALKVLKGRCVDGYVIAGIPCLKEQLKILISSNTPVVIYGQDFADLKANYVLTDDYNALHHATLHLIARGLSKIGFVTSQSCHDGLSERLGGYLKAVCDHNIIPVIIRLEEGASSRIAMANFYKTIGNLEALIFASSQLTKVVLEITLRDKIDIFKTKGIIAFDDFDLLKYLSPSITAISQSAENIGHSIVDILLRELTGLKADERTFCKVKIAAKLIKRESTTLIAGK